MTEISKAEVYRKAAEIIVRDGMAKGTLVEGDERKIVDPAYKVCALGACARAEYELYGTLPLGTDLNGEECLEPYAKYDFRVPFPLPGYGEDCLWSIPTINDQWHTSAEDIALLLKKHAEEVDDADGS